MSLTQRGSPTTAVHTVIRFWRVFETFFATTPLDGTSVERNGTVAPAWRHASWRTSTGIAVVWARSSKPARNDLSNDDDDDVCDITTRSSYMTI